MSSDIQFGDLEEAEPQRAIRPDQDAHFATAKVGNAGKDELLIFVDLDVMRDMEAHALSNTRVELGGVMLGHQQIDDRGRPFVVVTDCLRAEHYEATSVNFKFTHATWSQITKQRQEFRPDLEMIGWYHTHPGLTVFLSGMDLFICNHFFNRPLDVALVIDPCGQDRGWFQWTGGDRPTTHRTGGFVMTTGRLRQLELDQFARIYNHEPKMQLDPRYSGQELAGTTQPLVSQMDHRKPVIELAIVAMLAFQFCLFCVFAWRFLDATESKRVEAGQEKIVELEGKLDRLTAAPVRSIRESALQDILTSMAAGQPGVADWANEIADLKIEQAGLHSNLEGQQALVNQVQSERTEVQSKFNQQSKDIDKLKSQLVNTRSQLKESRVRVDRMSDELAGTSPPSNSKLPTDVTMAWWWLALGSLVVGGLGAALGFAWGNRESSMEQADRSSDSEKMDEDAEGSREFAAGAPISRTPKKKQESKDVSLKIDDADSAKG